MSANGNKSAQLVNEISVIDGNQTQTQHDNKRKAVAESEDLTINAKVSVNTNIAENSIAKSVIDTSSATNMPNIVPSSGSRMTIPESTSDFKDWLEGIKMVARLPGGMPIEFRRKLWLALAERYLKRRGVDWEIEKIKWFSEKSRADDEELGIQIVKDLHRTGHSLLSGPNGALNQAKLKRILMGYTRWNPEVGYCQGFNMLGAIILQVMDKNEVDSIKVMIFLIEGLLPNGYFCGSLMGLQVDMAVFRELLGNKLPKLARHLQKLQYSTNEPSVEPPLINVFTMQWFLTLFCNCVPMICVLRIWDLIMIEGSDVLLRTALALWKIMENRILREVRTADDFYCKMETLSAELLDENMIDSNVLIQMISDLGPVKDLQKLRQKHLTASYQDQKQLKMIYSKVQGESERLAVANAWQSNRTRRGSNTQPQREPSDREKIAIDITILKKQYDKLRERQKQAHIILTSAVTKQNQQKQQQTPTNVNKLLAGKHAIVSKGGRRAPPKGAIPPARKLPKSPKTHPSPGIKTISSTSNETLHWKNTDEAIRRKNSLTWKEINAESRKRSDSSSYSENSDTESSTSTSLCDDDNIPSLDSTPVKKKRHKDTNKDEKCAKEQNTIPKLSEIKSCPEIALECLDEIDEKEVLVEDEDYEQNTQRSSSKFHLALSPEYEGISSISQLSPMPDISSYFTAISPIKTPCNYFEFPDFSSFTIDGCGSSNSGNDKYEVNEQGVTNEFFERVTSSNVFSILPPHVAYDMSYKNIPSHMTQSLSSSDKSDNASFDENEQKMSQSYSNDNSKNCNSKEKSSLKHVNQKSFSMEEGTSLDNDDTIKINRSYSDGTIMECDDFQKIIAENSKILTKMRTFIDSAESLSTSTNTAKLIEETIIEEVKTSSNSSECEEIAAIDIEEPSVSEMSTGIFLPQVQDIAEIEKELLLKSRNSDIDTKQPSATLPLLMCNAAHGNDVGDDVTVQNEKSMNEDKNSDALATPRAQQICSSNNINRNSTTTTTVTSDCTIFAQKTLPLNVAGEGDDEIAKSDSTSELINSPKFNEISALVDKLKKEVMESEKSANESEKLKVESAKSGLIDESEKTVVAVSTASGLIEAKGTENEEKVPVKVTIKIESSEDDIKENTIDLENSAKDSASATAAEVVQKIDSKNSNSVSVELNTQLEKSQEQPSNNNHLDNATTSTADNICDGKAINNGNDNKTTSESKIMSTEQKDSSKILEKLNFQLQRYEDTRLSTSVISTSRSPSNERSNDYKRELEALIKEREIEKTQKYRLNEISSSKSNHSLYDHEPRNDLRRRDIIGSLESEEKVRRPFKSSPSSSLSSSPSNISNTLSSIQNTIKSLDSACQRSEIYNYKKLDKAMESIEKICESDRDWHYYKRIKTYESPPSFKIDDILITKSQRNDDFMTFNRYDSDTTARKPKTPELDPDYIAKLRCLSTEEYIAGRKSPHGLSPSRETTRYSRIDRSPTSPILSSRFLKSPTGDRGSKSAENSPSRYTGESTIGTRSRYIPSTSSSDLSNLNYKSTVLSESKRINRKYYDEFEWEKTSSSSVINSRRKYDI